MGCQEILNLLKKTDKFLTSKEIKEHVSSGDCSVDASLRKMRETYSIRWKYIPGYPNKKMVYQLK